MNPATDPPVLGVDLSTCDREPIHIPGRVQGHGVLFALREPDLTVTQVSANLTALLGLSADEVLGRPVDALLAAEDVPACREWLGAADVREASPTPLAVRGRVYDASAHRQHGALILELENPRAAAGRPTDFRMVRTAMARLEGADTLAEFCRVAANELRAITGFDRVTVYRFDQEWNGQVFAEARRADLTPLLDLHFPASDIPKQARRLYELNKIRLIADVNDPPAPLVPEANPTTGRPLDLSFAVLRSVSPVHIQYLKNMGAHTSMSISLIKGGRLWGLLSCMHYSGPRYVPPGVRDACAFLGELVSAQLAVKEETEGIEHRGRLQEVRERLLQRMSADSDLGRALDGPDLLTLTGATGAAIVTDANCTLVGFTPTTDQVKRLLAWLRVHTEADVFHTDGLPGLFPEAAEYKGVASGLMAVSTTKTQGHTVLWFRPEVVQTVNWGGDPRKAVEGESPTGPLSPRRSFELWQEIVKDKSLPWRPWEVAVARLLRDAIIAVVVRRAEELTRLNAELERSNSDLDAFAFVTSHDLKEPLRGINNYATFLMEDYGHALDADGKEKLRTLVRLSQRLEDIVESLLRYSRLGREDLSVEPTDLNPILAEVLDILKLTLVAEKVEVRVPRPLPVVRCDKTQANLLFTNLITNAVKYNDKPAKWVEVGYREPLDGTDRRPVLYVKDNGIGVPEKHRHAVFRMFKRLHARDKFGGGTGAGLAFAKKVVERHGGSIWVESTPGEGATFYFTLGG